MIEASATRLRRLHWWRICLSTPRAETRRTTQATETGAVAEPSSLSPGTRNCSGGRPGRSGRKGLSSMNLEAWSEAHGSVGSVYQGTSKRARPPCAWEWSGAAQPCAVLYPDRDTWSEHVRTAFAQTTFGAETDARALATCFVWQAQWFARSGGFVVTAAAPSQGNAQTSWHASGSHGQAEMSWQAQRFRSHG